MGRIGGENDVETTDRRATGVSNEATVVRQPDHLEGDRVAAAACHEGHRPVRMIRTLSSDAGTE